MVFHTPDMRASLQHTGAASVLQLRRGISAPVADDIMFRARFPGAGGREGRQVLRSRQDAVGQLQVHRLRGCALNSASASACTAQSLTVRLYSTEVML